MYIPHVCLSQHRYNQKPLVFFHHSQMRPLFSLDFVSSSSGFFWSLSTLWQCWPIPAVSSSSLLTFTTRTTLWRSRWAKRHGRVCQRRPETGTGSAFHWFVVTQTTSMRPPWPSCYRIHANDCVASVMPGPVGQNDAFVPRISSVWG